MCGVRKGHLSRVSESEERRHFLSLIYRFVTHLLTPLEHYYDTLSTPYWHPIDTLLTPYRHPIDTLLTAFIQCHFVTHFSFCHSFLLSVLEVRIRPFLSSTLITKWKYIVFNGITCFYITEYRVQTILIPFFSLRLQKEDKIYTSKILQPL